MAVIVFMFGFGNTWAQFIQTINFDNNSYKQFVYRDTTSNPNCIWQVGKPQKTVFDSSLTQPNVIVTDTVNNIPTNDTSVFYIKHAHLNIFQNIQFSFSFLFRIDGDSNDFGMVEVSPDLGHQHWINLMTDTNYNIMWNILPKPTLRGNCVCTAFMGFGVDLTAWANASSGYPVLWDADTTLFRITYITDSNNTNRDGLMIDDITIQDFFDQGVENVRQNGIISIAPNPIKDELHFIRKKATKNESVTVFNFMGVVIFHDADFKASIINTNNFPPRMYLLHYSSNEGVVNLKFEKV